MNLRALISSFAALAAPLAFLEHAHAVTLTVNDQCGGSISGTPTVASGNPVTVDSSGNITAQGLSGSPPYIAGFGQCDALPADGKPVCTISASKTKVGRNTPVTLYAKCTQNAGTALTYTWYGPAGTGLPAPDSSPNSATVTITNAGVFSYSVTAKSSGVAGRTSAPVTVLVGDATDKPSCTLAITPQSMNVHDTAIAQVTCQPAATSFAWDATPAFGPTPPGSPTDAGNLTFDAPGSFPYFVSGTNAAGTGAKATAQVYVQSNLQYRSAATKSGGGVFNFPAGVTSTDFLVLYVLSPTGTTVPTPTGWTVGQSPYTWSAGQLAYIFGKIVGSETSVTLPSGNLSATIVAYSGASGFGQVGTFVETAATATSCSKALPSALTPGSVIVSMATDRDATYPGVPSGYAQRAQILTSINRTTVADKFFPSGGTTGNVTSSMVAGSSGICTLVEVKP